MTLVPVDYLPPTMFQLIYIFIISLRAHLVSSYPLLARGNHDGKNFHWVNIWTAMPQLVEPTNLPPVPFVRWIFIMVMGSSKARSLY